MAYYNDAMIVYGDPAYYCDWSELVGLMRARIRTAREVLDRNRAERATGGGAGNFRDDLYSLIVRLDALRELLVLAGQIEQAAVDASDGLEASGTREVPQLKPQDLRTIEAATFLAARAFTTCYLAGCANACPDVGRRGVIWDALDLMEQYVQAFPSVSATMKVKVPEGFAFYALYPEQYIRATMDWIAQRITVAARSAVVVGIRSIGTTLSATVAATLAEHGWQVSRLTVRPFGHPFERQVEVDVGRIRGADCGLIVDEGPGLSGSSMAAAASALTRAGIDTHEISVMPGHQQPPGHAASHELREFWSRTPRYVTPLSAMRWAGRSLVEVITECTPRLLGCTDRPCKTEDFSAGQWRYAVMGNKADWPAVCSPFERTKYRSTPAGAEPVIWKFGGFACGPGGRAEAEVQFDEIAAKAQAGWTAAPLGTLHGFVVTPWIQGRPLKSAELNDAMLARMGRYIARAAGPVMSADQRRAARQRLDEILYWNVRESCGEDAADRLRARFARSSSADQHQVHAFGDGHLAPHEWLRTGHGELLKVDCCGHGLDHTAVDMQSVLWDLAGAMVEWDMSPASASMLVEHAQAAGLAPVHSGRLGLHEAAYAAFRWGQCTMCAESAGKQSEEGQRLAKAADYYHRRLMRMIGRNE